MSYRVVLNERAEGQLEAAYLWWLEHRSPDQATRWYNGFLDAMDALRQNPDRFGVAPRESQIRLHRPGAIVRVRHQRDTPSVVHGLA